MTESNEQPSQGKIRTLGEKETYKYLEILKAGTIEQVKMKQKNTPKERESYSKPNYAAEISSKGTPGLSHS